MIIRKIKCYICGDEDMKWANDWIKIKKFDCDYVNHEDYPFCWQKEHICPKCIIALRNMVKKKNKI